MYVIAIYAAIGIILAVSYLGKKEIPENLQAVLYAIVMIFFILRFPLGNDIPIYKWLFDVSTPNILTSLSGHMSRNFLFTELAWLCKAIFREFRGYVLVLNLIMSAIITVVIHNHGRHWLFGILLFIGSGMLEVYYTSGLRQAICMVIMLYAIAEVLPKRKYLLYELLCLAAVLCHDVGFFAIPLPLLLKLVPLLREKPKKLFFWSAGITGAALLLNLVLVPYMAMRISGGYIVPPWMHGIIYFLDADPSVMGIGMEVVFAVVIGFLLMNVEDWKRLEDFDLLLILIFFFSIAVYLAFLRYSLMSRIADALQLVQIILVPRLIQAAVPKKRAWLFAVIFLLNGFLLFSDLNAKCGGLSKQLAEEVTLKEYPYISLFDESNIQNYLEGKIWQ